MNKKTIYEQRKRDRERLLKLKELQKKQNKILEQIKPIGQIVKNIK